MTLYDLTAEMLDLSDLLTSGDIDDQTYTDTLESLQFDTEAKLEGYAKLVRSMEAEAEAYKAEADRFAAKRKAAENAATRMKERVNTYLLATGQEKAKAGLFSWSQGQPSTEVVDKKLIPAKFARQKVEIDFPLTPIKEAILAGEVVPGARLIRKAVLR